MQLFGSTERTGRGAGGAGGDDWAETPEAPRDWRKGVLIAGLGILSWVATYVGMLELIEANMGELPMVHRLIVAFSVGMLMIMIVWLLDQLFAPLPFTTKVLYALGYVFLTLISVGFGFGFYWKVLESRGEASRSAEGAVGQVQTALLAASTRLDQLQGTLDQLTQLSKQKAENERATGTSCPASRAGDGPRRKMREDDAARFEFGATFVKGRATQVKGEIAALEGDLMKIAKNDASIVDAKSGTRNEFMKSLGRKLDGTVTGFNAFRTDPQLKQIRADLAERADKTTFPDSKGGTYSCPDGQLSAALKGVVRAIDGLPEMERPKIASVEGSEATIEAFRRLMATLHGLVVFRMPPSADDLRDLQKKAVQSVESPQAMARLAQSADVQPGLSKRDYVPLAVALFVDLCLLLVSMGRPVNRLQGLVPKMRAAERGPVIQILSRFSDIHRDEKMRECFEVLRHVVFDYAGAYYVAVPLDAPYTETRREQVVDPRTRKGKLVTKQLALSPARREELRVEAHLLGNLFASFEKDNVFKRVMWLNMELARRRLQQQGSKFANSEAFRVYRFGDGAWSEIILGAVMGAARRVEARRGSEVDGEGRRQPTLDSLFDRMRQAEVEAELERNVPRPKSGLDWRRGQPEAGAGMASHLPHHMPPAMPVRPEPPMPADPDVAARFGPYASRVQHEPFAREDLHDLVDDTRPYANSNTRTANGAATMPGAAGGGAQSFEPTVEPVLPDADNIVPFKQPRGFAGEAEAGERAEMKMPAFMTRGQTALQPVTETVAPVGVQPTGQTGATPTVTVTATERRMSFELPLNGQGQVAGLYGLSAVLGRVHQSAEVAMAAAGDAPQAVVSEALPADVGGDEIMTVQRVGVDVEPTVVTVPGGAERSTALALPMPIRVHEHRG